MTGAAADAVAITQARAVTFIGIELASGKREVARGVLVFLGVQIQMCTNRAHRHMWGWFFVGGLIGWRVVIGHLIDCTRKIPSQFPRFF
jgi:hypothetical protein